MRFPWVAIAPMGLPQDLRRLAGRQPNDPFQWEQDPCRASEDGRLVLIMPDQAECSVLRLIV